jgi:hypothetical protein
VYVAKLDMPDSLETILGVILQQATRIRSIGAVWNTSLVERRKETEVRTRVEKECFLQGQPIFMTSSNQS